MAEGNGYIPDREEIDDQLASGKTAADIIIDIQNAVQAQIDELQAEIEWFNRLKTARINYVYEKAGE